ncbi:pyruvate kinase [Candidatus Poribacteria bacterium]|nr:pyruvate kinase [Candidatus Poribacteria bacterium]
MRKTKIVCSIGPASRAPNILEQLIINGMEIGRINFSHGTLEEKAYEIKLIKRLANKINKPITIVQDLCGPKIRVGEVENGLISLQTGDFISLTSKPMICNSKTLYINYPYLIQDIKKNNIILLDDGHIELIVYKIKTFEIICEIIRGGNLKSNKGINFPSIPLRIPALTSKDINDVKFGVSYKVDYIALSFVRFKEDIIKLKKLIKTYNSNIPVIAKIEKNEAIHNIDDIIKAADGIMIARGDLGVEVPIENVPVYQKMIIRKSNNEGKPVITATQMLESMIENSSPTRAEVADISNAILDGTDAVMLSGETSIGKYPIESVKIMSRVAEKTEEIITYPELHLFHTKTPEDISIADAVAHGTCHMAYDLRASAIITFTTSGYTARMISKYRPKTPIYVFSTTKEVARIINLFWGVRCFITKKVKTTDEMFKHALQTAQGINIIHKGDLIILTAGIPVNEKANTNLIRVVKVS